MVLSDLGFVLAIIGATGATVITFILPGAAYYSMHQNQGPAWKRYCSAALFISGVIFMPVCLVFIFV
jgi:amino acid permease